MGLGTTPLRKLCPQKTTIKEGLAPLPCLTIHFSINIYTNNRTLTMASKIYDVNNKKIKYRNYFY